MNDGPEIYKGNMGKEREKERWIRKLQGMMDQKATRNDGTESYKE